MEYDEHGLPRPPGFDDRPKRYQAHVTLSRVLVLLVTILLVGTIAGTAELGPDFWNKLDQKVKSLFGRTPRAMLNRIQAKSQAGDLEGALADANTLARDQPALGHRVRAALLQDMGRLPEAIEAVSEAIKAKDNDVGLYIVRAELLGRLKRYRESIADYTAVIQLDPSNATAYNNRAYHRALAGTELEEAFADIEKCLDLTEDFPQWKSGLSAYIDTRGYLYYLRGELDKALADFNRILEHVDQYKGTEAGLGETYFHRGLVHEQMGKQDEATKDFDIARRLGYEVGEHPLPVTPPRK